MLVTLVQDIGNLLRMLVTYSNYLTLRSWKKKKYHKMQQLVSILTPSKFWKPEKLPISLTSYQHVDLKLPSFDNKLPI